MLSDRIGLLGLWTDSNAGLAPVGALLQASEVVLDTPGVARPARGLPRLYDVDNVGGGPNRVRTMEMFRNTPVGLWYLGGGGAPMSTGGGSWGASVALLWWNGSAWVASPGTRTIPDLASGFRPQMAQAGRALYWTSEYGLQFVDDLVSAGTGDWGAWRSAGLWRPLDVRGAVAGTSGFLPKDSAVAYRTVHGFTDATGRVHLSAPSQREVVINPPAISVAIGSLTRTGGTTVTGTTLTPHGFYVGQTVTVSPGEANFAAGNKTITAVTALTFSYAEAGANVNSAAVETFTPSSGNVTVTQRLHPLTLSGAALTAGYWFTQVYRTKTVTPSSVDPGDDMQLVYEHIITTAELAANSFSFTDSVGDGGRGDALYTNRYEEGIANANDPPPYANAIGVFRDHLFCGDVTRKQQLRFKLIGIGSPSGLQVGDSVWIYGDTYSAATTESGSNFALYTAGTLSQNIEKTARSLVRVINAQSTYKAYQAAYISGPDDEPGQILIEERGIHLSVGFNPAHDSQVIDAFTTSNTATRTPGEAISPALPTGYMALTVARVGTTVTVTTALSPHPFAVGQRVWLGYVPNGTQNADFPTGWKTVASVPAGNKFTYTETGAATTDSSALYFASTRRLDEVAADDSASKGAVEISKPGEHDAVPQENRWYPGDPDARVLCFGELANQFYVFKEDGAFRLVGTSLDDFDFEPAHPNFRLIARDSLRKLGEVLLGLTDRGVTPLTPGGVAEPISVNVNNLIPMRSPNDLTFLAERAWAYVDPKEQLYVLYALASAGTSGPPDPTGALIWNAKAPGWTTTSRHPLAAGVVDPATGYFYAAEAGTAHTRRDARVGNPNDGWSAFDFHDGSASIDINGMDTAAKTITLTADPMINGQAIRRGDLITQDDVTYTRITGVSGLTLSVQTTDNLTVAAATLYRGYSPTVQWVRWYGTGRGVDQFTECILGFGESGFGDSASATSDTSTALYGAGYLTFATEAQALDGEFTWFQGLPGYGSVQAPLKPLDVRMAVPAGYQRANWISPCVTIPLALARWQLDGVTFKHRFVSSRVGG